MSAGNSEHGLEPSTVPYSEAGGAWPSFVVGNVEAPHENGFFVALSGAATGAIQLAVLANLVSRLRAASYDPMLTTSLSFGVA